MKSHFLFIILILMPVILHAELKEIRKGKDTGKKSTPPYVVKYHSNSKEKMYEAIDSNNDGELDTWYYYNINGQRTRQEIDSNFDGKVDIWIYFRDGMYIERIDKDTDHDGKIDSERVYK